MNPTIEVGQQSWGWLGQPSNHQCSQERHSFPITNFPQLLTSNEYFDIFPERSY